MRGGRLLLIGIFFGVGLSLGTEALAQQAILPGQQNAGQPILPRVPLLFAPKGLPLGGFRLYPVLELGVDYDDNVYRAQTNAIDDFFFSESSGFVLQSQWSRHGLELFGVARTYQYASLSTEDHTDVSFGGHGKLDILRGIDFVAGGSYNIYHEQRNSPDQPGFAKTPTKYALTLANAAFEYHPYHFSFTLGGNFSHYQFSPTPVIGFPTVMNSDRNRNEYEAYVKLGYEFSPGYAIFGKVADRSVNYTYRFDRNGLQRDNHGYHVDIGLNAAVTDLITGHIFVGYLNENYHAPLKNISGFNFGANLEWSVTRLWTIRLEASRFLNGTTLNNASAEDDQTVRLNVDFSARPDIMINGHVIYTDANFSANIRHDTYKTVGIGVNYYMNHNVSAKLTYDYENRNSTIPGQGFDDNTVSFRLALQL